MAVNSARGRDMPNPFEDVKTWQASEGRRGIDKVDGVPYTYDNIGRHAPDPAAPVYRVETWVEFPGAVPIHRRRYFVPAPWLDPFFDRLGERQGEGVIDIRLMTLEEAFAELHAFRERFGGGD
jgi:hypothetical protein